MTTIKIDLGEEWVTRMLEQREWLIKEIAAREETGAPLVDEANGDAPLTVPREVTIIDAPLKGWTATVKVLPYGDVVGLEQEIDLIASAVRMLAREPDIVDAAARSVLYTKRLIEVQAEFLRASVVSLEQDGEPVSVEDLYGDTPMVYGAIKAAHHLSRERKKKLAASEPSI